MKIIHKETLADIQNTKITRVDITCPHVVRKVEPGQFIVVMVSEEGERIPLTVVDKDIGKGTITLIFQEVGLTTKLLGKLKIGDSLYALAGPLGHPTEIKKYGNVILVGGGVGIAEIYPVAKALNEAGNHIDTVLGARTKSLLILEDGLKEVSNRVFVATDDGSYGQKGFTTDILKKLLIERRYDLIYAVGPIPMMKSVSLVSKQSGITTAVSLNSLMVDATGMCGCCRVTVGGKTKFACVDGPEFDAHLVDWEELERRNNIYIEKEKHICNLHKL